MHINPTCRHLRRTAAAWLAVATIGATLMFGSAAAFAEEALRDMVPQRIKSAGVLRVGISPDFEPAEFYKPGTTEIAGYDPELIRAIAAQLGLEVRFFAVGYDGLIPGLQSDRFDVVMSGLTDTPEREKAVGFIGYLLHWMDFVAAKNNPAGISGDMASACGKRPAAEKGSITVNYAEQVKKICGERGLAGPSVGLFDNQTASTLALRSGRLDVAFRSPIGVPKLQEATGNAFVTFRVEQVPVSLLGIATPKDDTQLQKAVLAGLKAIQADGTYRMILTKWGIDNLAFDQPGINLAGTNPAAIPTSVPVK
jgi:polar amino acid transport system substrate-binding protein